MRSLIDRFEEKFIPITESGCWIWIGHSHKQGYGIIKIQAKSKLAHRVSYELYNSEIPVGLNVCHTCDITSCVNPNHLFLGTHTDNMRDKVLKNRQFRPNQHGEKNNNSKINQKQAEYIKSSDEKSSILAAEFNVSPRAIRFIRSGDRWRI